jgi:hypothetical protein
LSQFYLRLAESTLRDSPSLKAEVEYGRIAGLLHLGEARWSQAKQALDRSMTISEKLGDDYLRMFCLACHNMMASLRGDSDLGLLGNAELLLIARRMQNEQFTAAGLGQQAAGLVLRGLFAEAAVLLAEAARHAAKSEEVLTRTQIAGQRALCALRQAEPEVARRIAEESWSWIRGMQVTSIVIPQGLLALGEVYLGLWEEYPQELCAQGVEPPLRQLLKMLQRAASLYPVVTPRLNVLLGRYQWRCRRPRAALRHLRLAVPAAEQLGTRHAQGTAHLWLGRLAQSPEGRALVTADSRHHFAAARAVLQRCGASWECAQAHPEALTPRT